MIKQLNKFSEIPQTNKQTKMNNWTKYKNGRGKPNIRWATQTSYPHLQGFNCWSVKSISSAQRGQVFSPSSLMIALKNSTVQINNWSTEQIQLLKIANNTFALVFLKGQQICNWKQNMLGWVAKQYIKEKKNK